MISPLLHCPSEVGPFLLFVLFVKTWRLKLIILWKSSAISQKIGVPLVGVHGSFMESWLLTCISITRNNNENCLDLYKGSCLGLGSLAKPWKKKTAGLDIVLFQCWLSMLEIIFSLLWPFLSSQCNSFSPVYMVDNTWQVWPRRIHFRGLVQDAVYSVFREATIVLQKCYLYPPGCNISHNALQLGLFFGHNSFQKWMKQVKTNNTEFIFYLQTNVLLRCCWMYIAWLQNKEAVHLSCHGWHV